MNQEYLTVSFLVKKAPAQVFSAIGDVASWWSGEIEGETTKVGAEFTYRYPGMHFSRQRVIELIQGQRVVWEVVDAKLSYLKNAAEWVGTEIVFDIAAEDGETRVTLTHRGLTSECECFSSCESGWGVLIGKNLKNYVLTGKPQEDAFAA
jgi:hypothetical protein